MSKIVYLRSRGYDTVAYLTEGRPMHGKPEFEHVWAGSRWWFASAEHRDPLARDPEHCAPCCGGYGTGGLSLGYKMWQRLGETTATARAAGAKQ